MAGIREVAKYAGVSPSTVSRTLSGVAFVEPETKEKVMRAVRELNYKPNLAARSLKKGGSRLIGLVLPDISNPYFPEAVKYLEMAAAKAGYSLILCDALGDEQKETEYFNNLKQLCVDGILYISSTERIDHIRPYIGELPLVILNRTFEVEAPCINIDNKQAAAQALTYFMEQGHRKVSLFITDKERQYNRERLAGCRQVFLQYGVEDYESYMVQNIRSEEDAYDRTIELLRREDRPTGIFLFSDMMAYSVYCGIKKSGLRIPEDVSVIGFDDIPHVKYLDPPLTTVHHSLAEAADTIFQCLEQQIASRKCTVGKHIYFPGRLVVRESVQRLPDFCQP